MGRQAPAMSYVVLCPLMINAQVQDYMTQHAREGLAQTAERELSETAQSEVDPLERVLLMHAREAFGSQAAIDRQWRALGYTAAPDYGRAIAEYDVFAEVIQGAGVTVEWLSAEEGLTLDSMYVRDASIVSDRGAILCGMGKEARAAEPAAQREAFRDLGIPILGEIRAGGRLEGGDVVWLDERSVAVGRGYRTNDAGIAQLRELLGDAVDELIVVPLPHWRGPGDVFHLMSIISPIDRDLALVYSPLLPIPFREHLLERGYDLIEVPEAELDMGPNVLALGPRRCLMVEGHPETRRRLEAAGAEVLEYRGLEISRKGLGGPTCLTRPLARETLPRRESP